MFLYCLVFAMFLCASVFMCLRSPAGKGLTSCLWCLTVSLSLSHWYPGSGVVLDCIDSGSLHPYLLCYHFLTKIQLVEIRLLIWVCSEQAVVSAS